MNSLTRLLLFLTPAMLAGSTAQAADPIDTWLPRTSPTNINLTAVAYGNGTFVAIGEYYGIALTSQDGVTWTQRSTPIKTVISTEAPSATACSSRWGTSGRL